jgi:hypothetical protein
VAGCAGRCLSTQLPLATGNKFQRNKIYVYLFTVVYIAADHITESWEMIWQCYISLPISVSHSVSLSFQFYKVKGYDLTRSFSLATRTFYTLSFYFVSDFSISFERRRPKWITLFKWTAKCVGYLIEQQSFYLKWKWNDDGGSIEDLGDSGDRPDRLLFFYILPVLTLCVCIVYTSPRQHIYIETVSNTCIVVSRSALMSQRWDTNDKVDNRPIYYIYFYKWMIALVVGTIDFISF